MKSIYESIKNVMEMGARPGDATKNKAAAPAAVKPTQPARSRYSTPGPNQTNLKPGGGIDLGKQLDVKAAPTKSNRPDFKPFVDKPKPVTQPSATAPNLKPAPPKPAAAKPAAAKPDAMKDSDAGSSNQSSSYGPTAKKTEAPAKDGVATPNVTPWGGKKDEPSSAGTPFGQQSPVKDVDRSPPKAAAPEVDKEATSARDGVAAQVKSGAFNPSRGQNVERSADTEKFVTKTYTKPEEDKNVVRSSSGEPVKSGGGNLRTDTPDEIANRGPFGIPKKKTNEQFGVSDYLYNSVMEVMQKGSKPRHEKEKQLAAMHGDPDVITHGDVLKARGVKMKNEAMDPADEKLGKQLDSKLKTPNLDNYRKSNDPSVDDSKVVARIGATADDIRGQRKYTERTSGGFKNKIKDVLGLDRPDSRYGPKQESMDTPGNSYEHQCAIHVKSESFGEGRTITTQHADPDHDGNIAWYDVMFEHGIEKHVPTNELEILVSESHMHSKRKTKKM